MEEVTKGGAVLGLEEQILTCREVAVSALLAAPRKVEGLRKQIGNVCTR